MIEYKSHPDKLLEVHTKGVLDKMERNCRFPMAKIAVLFHDLGKINPNFQEKLKPENKGKELGYTNHAYLSAYIFLSYLNKNQIHFKDVFGSNFRIIVKSILAIIAKHHGNLPDFTKMLSLNQIEKTKDFISSEPWLPISDFLSLKLIQSHIPFEVTEHEYLTQLSAFTSKDKDRWQSNSLNYFLDTQFAFSALIEADKRDAGDKALRNYYHFESAISNHIQEIEYGLTTIFNSLNVKENKSELDTLRTAIRNEAIKNIEGELEKGKRLFSLTAPTGAGKTFTLLALAREIQRKKGNLGILYTLPFLSITEQVENLIKLSRDENGELTGFISDLLSFNSKSINTRIDAVQDKLDSDGSEETLNDLLQEDFIQQTFDHPFVLTTFVQFFETLLSNHNSTLLKLPNFANRIFLIDEIQALPSRLYIFFAGWLNAFCEKNNSYAILSTATMPHFEFPIKDYLDEINRPELLFKGFEKPENKPFNLIDAKKYYDADIFNRYKIDLIQNDAFNIQALKDHINSMDQGTLIILNTIDDTKRLYDSFEFKDNLILLNTHFIPLDRRRKIDLAKNKLAKGEKIVVISTQLIEAGVDIDFPIVYRDACPLPSLIQSAGRCNRNKKLPLGQVYFFELKDDKGKSRAKLIYKDEAKLFLEFCKNNIQHGVTENQLFSIQKLFFKSIANDLTIGEYSIDGKKENLIQLVNEAKFETIGKFQLINEIEYGSQFQYYIRADERDNAYNELIDLMFKSINSIGYAESKRYKIEVNTQLKKMSGRLLSIRLNPKDLAKAPHFIDFGKEYMGIRVLYDLDDYSIETGIRLDEVHNSIL